MPRFQTAKLGLALVLSLTVPFSGFAKDKKKDVEAIGDRDVGKGVNFYSLEKEIALGKGLAQDIERRPRSSTIRSFPNTSTASARIWFATPTRKFRSPSRSSTARK